MIHVHLFTKKAQTKLYTAAKETAEVIGMLNKNAWLGVFEIIDGWCRVLTILGEGWVNVNDTEQRSPLDLHAQWINGKSLEYVSAA